MIKRGVLTVVSGFSGVGKGTLMKELVNHYDNYALSVSVTTRIPRAGEQHGREYFYITKEEFKDMIQKDELIEYAKYVNNYYGTPKNYVEEKLAKGKDVILEIEIQGALKIKDKYPETLLLFVMPPSADELINRLETRGTETKDVIQSRLRRADEEAQGIEHYNYLLINDELDICVNQMHSMIQNQKFLIENNLELIKTVKEELKQLSKGE